MLATPDLLSPASSLVLLTGVDRPTAETALANATAHGQASEWKAILRDLAGPTDRVASIVAWLRAWTGGGGASGGIGDVGDPAPSPPPPVQAPGDDDETRQRRKETKYQAAARAIVERRKRLDKASRKAGQDR
jgi:hypothetical protein